MTVGGILHFLGLLPNGQINITQLSSKRVLLILIVCVISRKEKLLAKSLTGSLLIVKDLLAQIRTFMSVVHLLKC